MTPLSLDCSRLADAVLVTVAGELDATNADWFESFVEHSRQPGIPVLFDLHGLTFMDSCGMNVLLRLAAAGPVHLAAVQAIPARVLQITGMWAILNIHSSVEQAVTALSDADLRENPHGIHEPDLPSAG
ncbi:STAS domain-containing protein [Nonomuraea jiangxiensis]|uniref:Anti-sigma factor antagonist n=1 Tax=Nonomuraea jiangxiensis TaxID=633440 RepID=A0A1G8Y297_9ACTN|nr:STAS domain-containing protein [Nonomuraea jiangxiensis]SDJ96807.1 anti-anti-sigma factor [Nonomuraea jiangxiensis]